MTEMITDRIVQIMHPNNGADEAWGLSDSGRMYVLTKRGWLPLYGGSYPSPRIRKDLDQVENDGEKPVVPLNQEL